MSWTLISDAEAKEAAAAVEKKPVKTTPPIQTIIYTVSTYQHQSTSFSGLTIL